MSAGFEIATSTVNITPDTPQILTGYIARTSLGQLTQHSLLEANITALRHIDSAQVQTLVLSVDTLFLDRAFAHDIARQLGRSDLEHCIIAVASHTHGAPNLLNRDFMTCPHNTGYREDVIGKICEALKPLLSEQSNSWHPITKLTSRVVSFSSIACRRRVGFYFDLRRRRFAHGCHFGQNPKGVTDPFIRGWEFHTDNGLQAIWWSLPAHPAFFPDQTKIHADFPGVVRSQMKRNAPDAAVAFFPGLSGSVIPKVNPNPQTGQWWRDMILRLPFVPSLGHFSVQEFENWCADISTRWETAQQVDLPVTGQLRIACTQIGTLFRPKDSAFEVRVAQLDVGAARLLLLSGEPIAAWQPVLASFASDHTIMSGYLAGDAGYIATPGILGEGGYEVDGFQTAFGIEGRLSRDADTQIHAAFERLKL